MSRDNRSVGQDAAGGPPPDAYGRVTNAERYRILHEAARELLDQLARDYAVERVTGTALDEELASQADTEAMTRLEPAGGGGAPLTVAFTRFPGLLVRFGWWHIEAYPACGCDACDEQPHALAEQLRHRVKALLLEEGFSESLRHGWRGWSVTMESRDTRSERTVSRERRRRLGEASSCRWSPWRASSPPQR